MSGFYKYGMFVLVRDTIKFFFKEKLVFSIRLYNNMFSVFVSKISDSERGKTFVMNEFRGAAVVLMLSLQNMGWDIDWNEISKFLFDKRVEKIFKLNVDNPSPIG